MKAMRSVYYFMGVLKLSSLGRHFRDPNYRALAALKTMSETDENFVRANPCSLEPWTQLSFSLTRKKVSHSGLRSKNRVVPRLTHAVTGVWFISVSGFNGSSEQVFWTLQRSYISWTLLSARQGGFLPPPTRLHKCAIIRSTELPGAVPDRPHVMWSDPTK